MDNYSIDIIVPTYRLIEKQLLAIINLPKPPEFTISIFIVSDNPDVIIPEKLAALHKNGTIQLLIHKLNLGPAGARNTGIRASHGKWILFLDDDIKPQKDLLIRYAAAINKNQSAIGFAGLTVFPDPVNAATKAFITGGWISHFTSARTHQVMKWTPTANVLLNREKMDAELFDETLRKSGEDIDFLVRNSLRYGEQYTGLPDAVVFHPWWNEGAVQTKRLWKYGEGVSDIARKMPIKNYTFRDFTNTSETALLLFILFPVAIFLGFAGPAGIFFLIIILAEFLTCWIKTILVGKTFSPLVALYLMWAKNCYEAGFLFRSLNSGFLNGFALRVNMGFDKPHPGPFRTNRWKIIKMVLIAVLLLIAFITL